MKTIFYFLPAFLLAGPAAGLEPVHHDIKTEIAPADGRLSVSDTLSFSSPEKEFIFSLHKGLNPVPGSGSLETLSTGSAAAYGIRFSSGADIYDSYRLVLEKPAAAFTLKYGGAISHSLGEQAEEYARSFSETPGLLSSDGCYLSGASGWYPLFNDRLVTFRLETSLPAPYDSVAGGGRTSRQVLNGTTRTVWEEPRPLDEITLTCGKYTEYAAADGRYYAFLRSPDPALAEKYLAAAAKYVGLYSGLIGPYPYAKFALVENFWETGYGFPSFTLLGPKVIRLPFILNSSYPHEILHNWWGDGVFVDYGKGNWCEGLTVYLADYLVAENRGKGEDYRMTALQKYSDYVREGADFPLTAFRTRHSSASEAVGYGKSLMFYHMLRSELGDENFRKALRTFYSADKFKTAGFDDLRHAFETVTGAGRLAPFFAQWVDRTGAPELRLKEAHVTIGLDGYDLDFTLAQVQDGPAYALEIPAAIYLENSSQPRMKNLTMTLKEETYHYNAPLRPARLEIDPEFDLFRKLSPLETPPTLSRLLGAARPAVIIPGGPAGAPWKKLAAAWRKDPSNLPNVLADDSPAPPKGSSYWVLGGDNRLAPALETGLEIYGARFNADAVIIENRVFPRAGRTFVFAAFHPDDPAFSGALVLSGAPDKLDLLASKLPHYGKYSWLVFDENMNSEASGIWTPSRSPLNVQLSPAGAASPRNYPARSPLAELPSSFSAADIKTDILALTSLSGGRGPDSPGLEKAAVILESEFKKAGLKPLAGHAFAMPAAGVPGTNIIGMVEGTAKKDEYVVLSAHYDHLAAKDGKIFPGADDNASGTALVLELARYYAAKPAARTIVFTAFSGEEEGRLGSKAFLDSLPPEVKGRINADLNFDTVGRLENGKILILGSGSSDKWVHIFRGAGFVTGTDYDLVKEDLDSSDQVSFIERGIPAVQFFSGPKADYHKPTDTPDKIDVRGIAKQAEFALEIIDYLAGDSDFITRPAGAAPAPAAPAGTRKVSTGLVPDFSFQGKGVKALEISAGSPLERAGLKAGDVITALNGAPTDDLRAYSQELKKHFPGERIKVVWLSDGLEKKTEIELAAK